MLFKTKISCLNIPGNPIVQQRKHSWQLLKRLANNCNLPWLCLGDFNEIMDVKEKWGGIEQSVSQINSFKLAIEEAGLIDLGYSSNQFTWSKGRDKDQRICERLDRALANPEWCANFPHNKVAYLNASYSNHIPIMVLTEGLIQVNKNRNNKRRVKKFEEFWTLSEECQNIIRQNWTKDNKDPADQVTDNGKKVLEELTSWIKPNLAISAGASIR